MREFKCKACGAIINVPEGATTARCEYCEREQTVPNIVDNEKLAALHNRANSLRLNNMFDKAIITYENIINENPKDAEAHWGLLLCRYGIEYVDDKATNRKIPTCHRTQLKSIFDDIDYLAAIENSDVVAKRIYQAEAEEINRLQKEILMISQKEEPYDIFICYKETSSEGKRTRDSVIAQEVYDELVSKGYRVFFSKITLESIPGAKYEPYIYAALSSAKVMLVIGTKPEYYNAVWVKNEWSRFISMMDDTDQKRYLIPCYRDMEAYELPEELALFQAQDMNKLGFIQDLVRGIDKIFDRTIKKQIVVEQTIQNTNINNNVSPLLRRSEILISDEDYPKAKEVLDNILNIDPENAKAYFLLMLIDLSLTKAGDLVNYTSDITNNKNFKKALTFADAEYKEELQSISNKIIKNNECKKHYDAAVNYILTNNYKEAIEELTKADDFCDAKDKLEDCKNTYQYMQETYTKARKAFADGDVKTAYNLLSNIDLDDEGRALFVEVNNTYKELKQREVKEKRSVERQKFITEENERLKQAGFTETVVEVIPQKDAKLGLFAKGKIKNGMYDAKLKLYNNYYKEAITSLMSLGFKIDITYEGNGGLVKLVNGHLIAKKPGIGESNELVVDKYTISEDKTATIILKVKWASIGGKKDGETIYFGEYPQDLKKEYVKITSDTPDKDGYYLGSDGARYEKVVADVNISNYYTSDQTALEAGKTYYFKVMPIKWTVQKTENDEGKESAYILLSETILDRQEYASMCRERMIDGKMIKPNNYEYSDVRSWLNNEFYKKAFNNALDTYILPMNVDNSIYTTPNTANNSNNLYLGCVCENTIDKVTIPCYIDQVDVKRPTDYAVAKGCATLDKKGSYFLRTPFPTVIDKCFVVSNQGEKESSLVYQKRHGIAPIIIVDTDVDFNSEPSLEKVREIIKAPMAGEVLDIAVNVGDKVPKGSTLLSLEAMKLKNEIVSPISGTVKEIWVKKGETVSGGQTLVIIEN